MPPRAISAALAAAALAALPPVANGQCEWLEPNRYGRWAGVIGFSLEYDPVRERAVHFTSGLTWEWDGDGWTLIPTNPLNIFLQRAGQAIAYDSVRQRIMLFGGIGGDPGPTAHGDFWEYDGVDWQRVEIYGPPPRHDHAMVYDSARDRLVVFGGRTSYSGPVLADTWEFDGVEWIDRTPAGASPAARHHHAMIYDASRLRTVLYGGATNDTLLGDTWEWDGEQWRQLIGAGPSPRGGSAITYHQGRQEVLLFGGGDTIIGPGAVHDDMWAWDGATWREIPSATSPGSRIFSNMVYVPRDDRVLLTGGLGPGWRGDHDTWAWDGEAWHKLLKTGPSPRMRHSAVYDTARRETLIINGARGPAPIREIWAWNGQEWAIRHQGGGPPEHVHNGAAFDQARGELVYFGGSTASGTTWTWNGHMWSAHNIPGPGPRIWPAMTYDAHRQRTILFGGRTAQWFTDTWEWDGSQWLQIGSEGPSGEALATFDSDLNRVIMLNAQGLWAYDGAAWQPFGGPPPLGKVVAFEYNPRRQRAAAYGPESGVSQVWEFDGASWALTASGGPSARDLTAMTWDPENQRMVLFGGFGESTGEPLYDLWELICDPLCYANCDSSIATPLLNIDDFTCFITEFAAAYTLPHAQQLAHYANCDQSTIAPILNVDDFTCFINEFAAGCP